MSKRRLRPGDLICVARNFPHQDDKFYIVVSVNLKSKTATVESRSQFSNIEIIPFSRIYGVMPKSEIECKNIQSNSREEATKK